MWLTAILTSKLFKIPYSFICSPLEPINVQKIKCMRKLKILLLIIITINQISCTNNSTKSTDKESTNSKIITTNHGFLSIDINRMRNYRDSLIFYSDSAIYGIIDKNNATIGDRVYNLEDTPYDTLMHLFNSIGFYPDYSILEFRYTDRKEDNFYLNINGTKVYLKKNMYIKNYSDNDYLTGRWISLKENNELYIDFNRRDSIIENSHKFSYIVEEVKNEWIRLTSDKDVYSEDIEGWAKWINNDSLLIRFYYSY